MTLALLFLILPLAPQDGDLECAKCGKIVSESETELKGHTPGPHAHPGPCRWRVHNHCDGRVRQPVYCDGTCHDRKMCGRMIKTCTEAGCGNRMPCMCSKMCRECAKENNVCARCGRRVEQDSWDELKVEDFRLVKAPKLTKNRMRVYLGTEEDAKKRAKAHLEDDKEEIEKLPPVQSKDAAVLYAIWGWSGSGLDAMRRTKVTVEYDEKKKRFRVTYTRVKYESTEGAGGTADMQFVGFQSKVGKLAEGTYRVEVFEVPLTYATPADKEPEKGARRLVHEFRVEIE